MMNGSLLYLKIFKYCTFSKRVLMLIAMLLSASGPIMYFIFCASIITSCFAYQGYVLFSPDVFEFRTVKNAFINGLKYWATSMDMREIRESNRGMGLLFYIMWTIIFLLILASVFVAILMDAYDVENEAIKADIRAGKKEKSFKELIMQAIKDWRDRAEAAKAKAMKLQRRASDVGDFIGGVDISSLMQMSPRGSDSSGSNSDDEKMDPGELLLRQNTSAKSSPREETDAAGVPEQGVLVRVVSRDKNGTVKVSLPSRLPKRGQRDKTSPSPPTPVPSTPMLSPSESAFRIPAGPPSPGTTKFKTPMSDDVAASDLQEA